MIIVIFLLIVILIFQKYIILLFFCCLIIYFYNRKLIFLPKNKLIKNKKKVVLEPFLDRRKSLAKRNNIKNVPVYESHKILLDDKNIYWRFLKRECTFNHHPGRNLKIYGAICGYGYAGKEIIHSEEDKDFS